MISLVLLLLSSQDLVVEMRDGVRVVGPVRVEVRNRGVGGGPARDPAPGRRFVSDDELSSPSLCDSWT